MLYIGCIILMVTVGCHADKTMKLEEFMTSLANTKSENFFENEDMSDDSDDSNQFYQRSGFIQQPQDLSIANRDQLIASLLQNLKNQERNLALNSESSLVQPRSPRNIQAAANSLSDSAFLYYPSEKETSYQSNKEGKKSYTPNFEASQNIATLQVQEPAYLSPGQQVSSGSQTTLNQVSAGGSQKQAITSANSDKTIVKLDRQGPYAYETGYQHAGYGNQLRNVGGYEQEHYVQEPHGYSVPTTKQVAIRLDPLGLVRLLLSGLPRPLLNLNGKVFFGVELGKGVGLAKGRAAPQPHYGGGGTVITLG